MPISEVLGSAAINPSSEARSRLCSLPAELQLKIFELCESQNPNSGPFFLEPRCSSCPPLIKALRCQPRTYMVALDVYYKNKSFCLSHRNEWSLGDLSTTSIARIRSLQIQVRLILKRGLWVLEPTPQRLARNLQKATNVEAVSLYPLYPGAMCQKFRMLRFLNNFHKYLPGFKKLNRVEVHLDPHFHRIDHRDKLQYAEFDPNETTINSLWKEANGVGFWPTRKIGPAWVWDAGRDSRGQKIALDWSTARRGYRPHHNLLDFVHEESLAEVGGCFVVAPEFMLASLHRAAMARTL